MLNKLFRDESGVIISAELALVLTIAVLAMVVGLSEVAVAVNTELNDISNAVGALNQTLTYTGFRGNNGGAALAKAKSSYAGGAFQDAADDCDANSTCDLVCGADATTDESKSL